jgi:hypothetical protein
MPRQQIHTVRRTVDVSPAVARQLKRLADFEACTVPELIRQAIRQAFGPPTEDDRHPDLFTKPKATKAARGGR